MIPLLALAYSPQEGEDNPSESLGPVEAWEDGRTAGNCRSELAKVDARTGLLHHESLRQTKSTRSY